VRLLVTGACGFVGSTLALGLAQAAHDLTIIGLDNLWRAGSETNRPRLPAAGIRLIHGDLRCASDLESLPATDWVIDAAANASVLAGVDGTTSPRQLVEHNLLGTLNLLEYCRRHHAGLILLSSSRVYSVSDLRSIPLIARDDAFALSLDEARPGLTAAGITEECSVGAPASLYGTTKLASEQLALEYADAFRVPVWIDRCGVLAGAGQFGQAGQGIFSWWLHRWINRRPLTYLGYGGRGLQVRDCFHPADLTTLVAKQLQDPGQPTERRVFNVAGGVPNSMSLAQLSAWCMSRFGAHDVQADAHERAYDVPWVVLDSTRAHQRWGWSVTRPLSSVLQEIADHAEAHPEWLAVSEG
jgi:CDP-paratose 2-epimerase